MVRRAIIALTVCMAPVAAYGQGAGSLDTPDAPPSAPPATRGIEEIVVTAQKRAESAQDVPISIQAFAGEDLYTKGLTDPIKLQTATPGLVYDSTANFSVIYLRGVGTDAFIPSADTSVATYVDDVYFPFSFGAVRSFGSVERVEILKGPQGTLFGRNATGGAIHITTLQPSLDEYLISTEYGIARFDEARARFFLSGPLPHANQTLGVSVGVIYNVWDDYYELTEASPQTELESHEEKGYTAKVHWAPWDFFDATATAYGVDFEGPGTLVTTQLEPKLLGTLVGIDDQEGDYETSINEHADGFARMHAEILTVNLRPRWFDVKSITGYQELEGNQLFDFDGTETELVAFGHPDPTNARRGLFGRLFTQEIQLLSNEETPGSEWLEWLAGFYYLDSEAGLDPIEFMVANLDVVLDPFSDLGLPSGANFRTRGRLKGDSHAGFFHATLRPLDWLSLTGGGRYQTEKRRVFKSSLNAFVAPAGPELRLLTHPERSLSTSDFSPKGVLDVRPLETPYLGEVLSNGLGLDDALLYFSYAKGFKSGSFNIISLTEAPAALLPEEVTTYELGLKSDLFEGRVRLNAALFQNDIDDLQVQFISLVSGGVVTFENAGKSTAKGADVSLAWAILDDLRLDLGAVYLDAKYDEYALASGFDPQTGLFRNDLDFTGNRIVRSPTWTVTSGLSYSPSVPGGRLEVGVDNYHSSNYFFDAQNASRQDAYDQLNLRLGYLYESWRFRVTAFGDNVTGARRYLFQFPNDFGTIGKLAPPAVYGVRLNWDF